MILNFTPEEMEKGARIYWTFEAMRKFGGGFVKMIGNMGAHADDNNVERIKKAWPEYWKQYEEMGQSLRKKKEEKDHE